MNAQAPGALEPDRQFGCEHAQFRQVRAFRQVRRQRFSRCPTLARVEAEKLIEKEEVLNRFTKSDHTHETITVQLNTFACTTSLTIFSKFGQLTVNLAIFQSPRLFVYPCKRPSIWRTSLDSDHNFLLSSP